uniref:Uncharacterized protein n=1 Tax=Anguilla anguilla TaxID=7936 RepID=A0A0E9Q6Z1_ANGAN
MHLVPFYPFYVIVIQGFPYPNGPYVVTSGCVADSALLQGSLSI